MSAIDKAKNKAEELVGKAKEVVGDAAGNENLKAEGQKDQSKADVKQGGEKVKDAAGDIKDDFDYGIGRHFESKLNHTIALKLKTGYLVRPDMLVYGIAGWQKGDFTYDLGGVERDYDADGYVVGLGGEKKLTERLSLTGEYEYSDFGRTDVDIFTDVVSKATPSFSNVKLGLNFKF